MTDMTDMTDDWPKYGEKIDLNGRRVYPVGWGLVYRVVCAPKDTSDADLNDIVSRNDPPGTSCNRWEVVSDESASEHPNWSKESGSKTARAQCPDCPGRHHVLMAC